MHSRQFHAAQWRVDHGGGKDRDRLVLSCFMERRHRRFRFSSDRTGATPDRRGGVGAVLQESSGAPEIENRASQNLRQRLDWNERRDSEGRHHRREFSCRGRISSHQIGRTEHGRGGESGGNREKIPSVSGSNAQRIIPGAQCRILFIRSSAFDIKHSAFSSS